MATPAGLHPASPPAIPGATAVAACASMAVSCVAVLYAPTVILRFPPPTSLRAFLHRRFACAAVASTASALATAALLRVWSLGDFADMLAVFGIRKDHLLQAVAIPLFLTSLVYAGSFVNRLWCIASSWGGDDDEVGIGCAQRLVLQIQAALEDVMVWRNYVVITEAWLKICMASKLAINEECTIYRGASFQGVHDTTSFVWWIQNVYNNFFESSLLQSSTLKPFVRATTARMQFYEVTTDCVQLGYTVIFGWYAAFLFIRTGNLLSPIVAHVFCNMMGLPVFLSPRTKGVASVAFLAGSVCFFWLLFPATSPELYNTRLDRCRCWHGFCNWR